MRPVEYSYQNPKEWTLENIPGRKQLDQITVKDITLILALNTHKELGCKASWEKRLKTGNRNTVERNRQEHSTRDRNKKRHELLVQEHTTQSHVLKG